MNWVEATGFTAAVLTTVAFFPQVMRSWKLRETKDLSLSMLLAMASGVFLWLAYGLQINDAPLIYANIITLALVLAQLVLKLKYG